MEIFHSIINSTHQQKFPIYMGAGATAANLFKHESQNVSASASSDLYKCISLHFLMDYTSQQSRKASLTERLVEGKQF